MLMRHYWLFREKVSKFIKAGIAELVVCLIAFLLSNIVLEIANKLLGERFDISDILITIQGYVNIVKWISLCLGLITLIPGIIIYYMQQHHRQEMEDDRNKMERLRNQGVSESRTER